MAGFLTYACPIDLLSRWPLLIDRIGAKTAWMPQDDSVDYRPSEDLASPTISSGSQYGKQSVEVTRGEERCRFFAHTADVGGILKNMAKLMILDTTLNYQYHVSLSAQITRVFIASGARPLKPWEGTEFFRRLYLAQPQYARGVNPFAEILASLLASGRIPPLCSTASDCWRLGAANFPGGGLVSVG
jgi:hypothetical protein